MSRLVAYLAHAPECDPSLAGGTAAAGDVLGRFELLREIGRGGFGVVFEARDRVHGRCVAVKTVRRGAPAAPACESLLRERELARLRHPNIATVLEGGRSERGPFVVLEHLVGETLAQRLARGALPVERTVAIAVAIARALTHAHARGVLHRDLKPGNVFLPYEGEPKVIDFGLASVGGRGAPHRSGTAGYMAPEQQRGDPEDARTDLFALGVLIREMTAGAGAPQAAEGAVARTTTANVSPELERIAAALVARDPARRPGSADEVLERLLRVRSGLAPRARRRRPSAGGDGRARRPVSPRRAGRRIERHLVGVGGHHELRST